MSTRLRRSTLDVIPDFEDDSDSTEECIEVACPDPAPRSPSTRPRRSIFDVIPDSEEDNESADEYTGVTHTDPVSSVAETLQAPPRSPSTRPRRSIFDVIPDSEEDDGSADEYTWAFCLDPVNPVTQVPAAPSSTQPREEDDEIVARTTSGRQFVLNRRASQTTQRRPRDQVIPDSDAESDSGWDSNGNGQAEIIDDRSQVQLVVTPAPANGASIAPAAPANQAPVTQAAPASQGPVAQAAPASAVTQGPTTRRSKRKAPNRQADSPTTGSGRPGKRQRVRTTSSISAVGVKDIVDDVEDPDFEDPGFEDPDFQDPGFEDPDFEDLDFKEDGVVEHLEVLEDEGAPELNWNLAQSPLGVDSPGTSQLHELFSSIIRHCNDHCSAGIPSDIMDRVMVTNVYSVFNAFDPATVAQQLVTAVPPSTRVVLGRPNFSIMDLLSIEDADTTLGNGKYHGVYVYVGVRKLEDGEEHGQNIFIHEGQRYEAGIYVGSATNSEHGISTRLTQHRRAIKKRLNGGERVNKCGMLYNFAGRPGVQHKFFVLALKRTDDPNSIPHTSLLEGIGMALLDCVIVGRYDSKHNPPTVQNFISGMRQVTPGLPSFQAFALNGAWSLKQAGLRITKEAAKHGCAFPGCSSIQKRLYNAESGAFTVARYCLSHLCQIFKNQPHWISQGPCVRCDRPRETGAIFYGHGDTSTCKPCYDRLSWLRKHGKPVPSVEEDQANFCGCGNCGIEEWWTTEAINGVFVARFVGLGDKRRCFRCKLYQYRNEGQDTPLEEQ
ncbi:hypothetical protein QBC40DRAFT_259740 [Triangularia verruculosa]|uniref:Uncharacterized protein n=1 Tax=Triangularia verruculosa TaxID=2587418 RepID=A0AAN7APK5_9PEZI|nr:hypothetical protein QBC40DRAFT_259740 [Triangularia verruculosa]